ncbi:antigen receptor-like protein [Perilla frutescens var. hirtella]|nr:antigen receptor-like protein [Perilla frutescens var. hirtella]
MDMILLQSMSLIVNERSERTGVLPRHSCGFQNFIYTHNLSRQTPKLEPTCRNSSLLSRRGWRVAFALNTDGFTANNNDQGNLNGDNPILGETRLGRIVSAGGRQLLNKLNSARKNFPMKVFLLLLGFYTANALATILGQTGDWDVLVAGLVVAAIEGIGMLMYKKPMTTGRLQSLVVMINYWKAGVCLGLFVDAFKLGS